MPIDMVYPLGRLKKRYDRSYVSFLSTRECNRFKYIHYEPPIKQKLYLTRLFNGKHIYRRKTIVNQTLF